MDDDVAREWEELHGELFNEIEQRAVSTGLSAPSSLIRVPKYLHARSHPSTKSRAMRAAGGARAAPPSPAGFLTVSQQRGAVMRVHALPGAIVPAPRVDDLPSLPFTNVKLEKPPGVRVPGRAIPVPAPVPRARRRRKGREAAPAAAPAGAEPARTAVHRAHSPEAGRAIAARSGPPAARRSSTGVGVVGDLPPVPGSEPPVGARPRATQLGAAAAWGPAQLAESEAPRAAGGSGGTDDGVDGSAHAPRSAVHRALSEGEGSPRPAGAPAQPPAPPSPPGAGAQPAPAQAADGATLDALAGGRIAGAAATSASDSAAALEHADGVTAQASGVQAASAAALAEPAVPRRSRSAGGGTDAAGELPAVGMARSSPRAGRGRMLDARAGSFRSPAGLERAESMRGRLMSTAASQPDEDLSALSIGVSRPISSSSRAGVGAGGFSAEDELLMAGPDFSAAPDAGGDGAGEAEELDEEAEEEALFELLAALESERVVASRSSGGAGGAIRRGVPAGFPSKPPRAGGGFVLESSIRPNDFVDEDGQPLAVGAVLDPYEGVGSYELARTRSRELAHDITRVRVRGGVLIGEGLPQHHYLLPHVSNVRWEWEQRQALARAERKHSELAASPPPRSAVASAAPTARGGTRSPDASPSHTRGSPLGSPGRPRASSPKGQLRLARAGLSDGTSTALFGERSDIPGLVGGSALYDDSMSVLRADLRSEIASRESAYSSRLSGSDFLQK